jgi:hypothetical protein
LEDGTPPVEQGKEEDNHDHHRQDDHGDQAPEDVVTHHDYHQKDPDKDYSQIVVV